MTATSRAFGAQTANCVPAMPFRSLRRMSDVDVRALYAYLKTVPARATGQL